MLGINPLRTLSREELVWLLECEKYILRQALGRGDLNHIRIVCRNICAIATALAIRDRK